MKDKHRIFVFGSNLAGIHGRGAALHAKIHYGAIPLCGVGHHGNSYAIPTKDQYIRTLPLIEVRRHISEFLIYVINRKDLQFNVTQVGCGLAGFQPSEIAPLFCAEDNLYFDRFWEPWIKGAKFWDGPL